MPKWMGENWASNIKQLITQLVEPAVVTECLEW